MATPELAPSLPLKKATISLPTGFQIGPVREIPTTPTPAPVASLGPLAAFVGDWVGNGFNTIFRPDSTKTPTVLPIPVSGSDNILELNLTTENLAFSKSLGSVPNRGSGAQADIFLNGIPYLQAINDVTNPSEVTGIHLEPGLWVAVPVTDDPKEGPTVARMASIPHGSTIEAQGTSVTISGAPTIPAVSITPTILATNAPFRFPSQTATQKDTPRIPQDLTPFISAGTITQAILDDPNTVLRNRLSGQKITHTTIISISTVPTAPLIGGGADNIAFLTDNARTTKMSATFWIETVEHTILVPVFKVGDPPLTIPGEARGAGQHVPVFTVTPPFALTEPRKIIVMSTQIQYSQTVVLNFNKLAWPHVSVATLVPSVAITVPPSAWA